MEPENGGLPVRSEARDPVGETPGGNEPFGHGVLAANGFKALFLERPDAVRYAARCHGVVLDLYATEVSKKPT
jgi:hypothetical protein